MRQFQSGPAVIAPYPNAEKQITPTRTPSIPQP